MKGVSGLIEGLGSKFRSRKVSKASAAHVAFVIESKAEVRVHELQGWGINKSQSPDQVGICKLVKGCAALSLSGLATTEPLSQK